LAITQSSARDIQRGGLMGERQFGIALTPKMYSMMSDRLYTDRVGSVVREVCSNAWDAMKMRSIASGLPQEPFKVTLPTDLEPHFIVEDTGPGMPDDVAQDLYSTLGLSTKEDTNDQIGAFGLGSKSPFAVTDTFTVENTYDGVTHHYLCFKSESGLPSILKTGETVDGRPNGVKVMIPAAGNKYAEYKRALTRQLIVMEPKPIINNIEDFEFVQAHKLVETEYGFILANAQDFGLNTKSVYARMGMVLYPLDVNQVNIAYNNRLYERLNSQATLILGFNIGDLEPLPSREGLTYDQKTAELSLERYNLFSSEYRKMLKKQVEEAPTPLDAWRKMRELKTSTNVDLSTEPVYNLGFVINDRVIDNAFPFFDYDYKKKVTTIPPVKYDEDGYIINQENTVEEVDATMKVSQFYMEEFDKSDLRLNIKRDAKPMMVNWDFIGSIDNETYRFLLIDELDPKHRIGRMKAALNSMPRGWSSRTFVVRVDPRFQGSHTDFSEFIKCFEALHPGITKKNGSVTLFSSIPRPDIVKRAREEDKQLEGVTYVGGRKNLEVKFRWSELDEMYSPDCDLEDDDYEEQAEKAKIEFSNKTFYVTALRDELTDYPDIKMDVLKNFAEAFGYKMFIVRKSGMGHLKALKEYGIREFKEVVAEFLDGYEPSDDYKKYNSAKKVEASNPLWFRYSFKSHAESLMKELEKNQEYVHPFLKERQLVERLASFDNLQASSTPQTRMIDRLRADGVIKYFDGYEWSKVLEIDVSEEFEKLENDFGAYYPAFELLARHTVYTDGVAPNLYQYVVDYNALRGNDVKPEEFVEEKEIEDEVV
jgi:hypothetical protein